MFEEELKNHLDNLCKKEYPDRMIGSPGNKSAEKYITQKFKSNKLTIELQNFDRPRWTCEKVILKLKGKDLPVYANPFSPSCDVVAPTIGVGSLKQLEDTQIKDKIVILSGSLAQNPLSPKNWILITDVEKKIIQLLEEKQPKAIIVINPLHGNTERYISDYEFFIPSVTVPSEVGLTLLQNIGSRVHLKISTKQSPSTTANIIGRKTGKLKQTILLCAHYDTKIDTPGGNDNAAGVAVILALAKALENKELPFKLEFVAFTSHEYSIPGSIEFTNTYQNFDNLLFVINFDGVGDLVGINTITGIGISEELQKHLEKIVNKYPTFQWTNPWYESDHSTFLWKNIPVIAISSIGLKLGSHSHFDTAERVDVKKLAEATELITEVLTSLQEKNKSWYQKRDS